MKAIAANGLRYNHLNLTRKVTINGKVLDYVYDASGQKLQMQYSFGTTNELTRYVGSVEYAGSAVKRISTSDGQFVFNTPPLGVGGLGFFQYNLTDHLGNVRVVVDEKGKTIQRTDYYPFGLAVPLTPSTTDSTRLANKYLYNGKELQPETGNLDYGARQYDATIGRMTSLDRFTEKYESVSGYQYGGNNPILYIDVNGDSLWVTVGDASYYYGYTKEGGYGFYDKGGNAYSGGDEFIGSVSSALGRLGLEKEGRGLVDFLSNATEAINIKKGNNTYQGSDKTVFWDPLSKAEVPTEGTRSGLAIPKPFISLGHELAHSEDDIKGTIKFEKTWVGSESALYSQAEKYATHRENQFRGENGLPLRTAYGVLIDLSTGIKTPDMSSRIIDSKGGSLFYKPINYRKK